MNRSRVARVRWSGAEDARTASAEVLAGTFLRIVGAVCRGSAGFMGMNAAFMRWFAGIMGMNAGFMRWFAGFMGMNAAFMRWFAGIMGMNAGFMRWFVEFMGMNAAFMRWFVEFMGMNAAFMRWFVEFMGMNAAFMGWFAGKQTILVGIGMQKGAEFRSFSQIVQHRLRAAAFAAGVPRRAGRLPSFSRLQHAVA